MLKIKNIHIILFGIITWTIFNSMLLFVGVYYIYLGEWGKVLHGFLYIYCLGCIPAFISTPFLNSDLASVYRTLEYMLVVIGYEVIVCGFTLCLWWKKQTIMRAYFLALAGLIASPQVIFIIPYRDIQAPGCFLAMTTFYAMLGILNILRKKYRPDIDLSRFLFWRRPWP